MLDLAFGLMVVAGTIALTVVMPIVSFVRARRALRIATETQERLDQLQLEMRRLATEPERVQPPAVRPPIPPPADVEIPPVPAPVAEPIRASAGDRLEQQIGSRWLLYVGMASLLLGISYFVKFAFDNGWVSERLRVAAAVLAGLAMIVAGVRFSSRNLALFGQALSGGGIVVLYLAVYAALHFYALVAQAPAFALMAGITAGAGYLAHRERAQPLALVAVLGGFATPLLIGGDRGVQVVLFTYIGTLIAGTLVMVKLHAWPLLSLAGYGCTFVVVLLWMLTSYTAAVWLRTELFAAAYAGMFVHQLWTLRQSADRSQKVRLVEAALSTAPLVFHVLSLYLLWSHAAALLTYFVLFTVAGLVAASVTRHVWVRVLTLILVGFPLMSWMYSLQLPAWYAPSLVTVGIIYCLHLASQWHAMSDDEREPGDSLSTAEMVHTQLNGLWLPATLYVFFDTRAEWWNARMAASLAFVNAGIAWGIRDRGRRLHLQYIALAATLGAVAVSLAFDGPVVALVWAAEGVMLGWLALVERSRLLGTGSAVMIFLGAAQLSSLLQQPLALRSWPMLNPRAAVVAIVAGLLAWLAWRMRHDEKEDVRGTLRNAVIILANLLVLGLLSADIYALFGQRAFAAHAEGEVATASDAGLMQQVALSVTWASYALGLVAVGIGRRYAPARYFGIVLFAITIVKVVASDIAELDRLYRMLSVLAVGVLLLAASYLYQRMGGRDSRSTS